MRLRLLWDDEDEDGRLAGVEAVFDEGWPRGLVRRPAGLVDVSCKGRVDDAEGERPMAADKEAAAAAFLVLLFSLSFAALLICPLCALEYFLPPFGSAVASVPSMASGHFLC